MKRIELSDFPFDEKIENMSEDNLRKRIEKAWNWEMPKLSMVPYIGGIEQTVEYKYPELTALCPVTGIQDLYTATFKFIPDQSVPELKSLKMYLLAFRDLPISHEHLQAKLFKDFKGQVQPKKLDVILDVTVRGGIYTKIQYSE